jgi:hypothetical protein
MNGCIYLLFYIFPLISGPILGVAADLPPSYTPPKTEASSTDKSSMENNDKVANSTKEEIKDKKLVGEKGEADRKNGEGEPKPGEGEPKPGEGELATSESPTAQTNALGVVVDPSRRDFSSYVKEWSRKAGEFYQVFEEYMGWDESSRMKKLDEKCRANDGTSCFKIAETRLGEGKFYEAESWYQLACTLKHSYSCDRFNRLSNRREKYERKLKADRLEVEQACEFGNAPSCAKAAYIADYFGETSVSEALNLKSCNLGYPAGCLHMARIEKQKGNLEMYHKYEDKARGLMNSH